MFVDIERDDLSALSLKGKLLALSLHAEQPRAHCPDTEPVIVVLVLFFFLFLGLFIANPRSHAPAEVILSLRLRALEDAIAHQPLYVARCAFQDIGKLVDSDQGHSMFRTRGAL
jgi:hypothetical protein